MNKPLADQPKTVVGWIFGGGFTFVGLLFLTLGGFEFWQGFRTKDWPAAPGRIVESKVSDSFGSDNGYTVSVRYSYEVDGQKFQGDRLRYGNKTHEYRTSALEEQSLYPPGKEVQVNYDPANPNQSVLIKGIGLSWVAIALGLMAFILGVIAMYYMTRARTVGTRVNSPAS